MTCMFVIRKLLDFVEIMLVTEYVYWQFNKVHFNINGCPAFAAFLFRSHVCYGDLGCFSQHGGFDNTMGELPASPDKIKVSLFLFTRDNPADGHRLSYRDSTSVSHSKFNSERDVKVVIHGYHSYGRAPWVLNMTKYLLELVMQ